MSPHQRLGYHLASLCLDSAVAVCQIGAEKFVRVHSPTAVEVPGEQVLGSFHHTLCSPIGLGVVGTGDPQLHPPTLQPLPHFIEHFLYGNDLVHCSQVQQCVKSNL